MGAAAVRFDVGISIEMDGSGSVTSVASSSIDCEVAMSARALFLLV